MEVNSILGRLCANASGEVVWLASDGKSGISLSLSRGLVSYDSVSDSFDEVGRDDGRLSSGSVDVFPDNEIRTVFGDAYLLFYFLYASTFSHCNMKSDEYLWPKTKRLVKDERRSKSELRVCA